MTAWIQQEWQKLGGLALLMFPFALLFRAAVALRRALYRIRVEAGLGGRGLHLRERQPSGRHAKRLRGRGRLGSLTKDERELGLAVDASIVSYGRPR